MKLSESQLRRIVRQQLRSIQEQAVATGARGRTPLSDQQKREIANRFRDTLEAALIDRGLVDEGENWSIMVNLGRGGWSMGKRAGVLSTADRGDVRRAVASVVPQFSSDRQNLVRGRRLKLALSDTGAPPAREEEDPAPQSPRAGPRRGGGGGGRPCVQMRQQDLNAAFQALGRETPTLRGNPVFPLDVDGMVGPMTQAAFYIIMERELVGDICDEANGIPTPESEEGPQSPRTDGDQPDDPAGEEPGPDGEQDEVEGPVEGPLEEDPCIELFETYAERACEDLSVRLEQLLESRMDNPLMKPSFYQKLLADRDLFKQFVGFGLLPQSANMEARFQRTLTLFQELLECSCRLGPGTHAQLVNELMEVITQTSYIFGRLESGFPDLIMRLGRSRGAAALRYLANSPIASFAPGLSRFKSIQTLDSEQEGFEGIDDMFGFDRPDQASTNAIMTIAAAMDRVICPEDGEDPQLPPRWQRRYDADCDKLFDEERGTDGGGGEGGRTTVEKDVVIQRGVAQVPQCFKVNPNTGEMVPDYSGTTDDGVACDNYLNQQEDSVRDGDMSGELGQWLQRQLRLAGINPDAYEARVKDEPIDVPPEEEDDEQSAGEWLDDKIDNIKGVGSGLMNYLGLDE